MPASEGRGTSSSELNKPSPAIWKKRVAVARMEEIFSALAEDPGTETCAAMKDLVSKGSLYVKAGGSPEVRDAGLIGAAQLVEHSEIAAYRTTKTMAKRLGESRAVELLQRTFDEESAADEKLTSIAEVKSMRWRLPHKTTLLSFWP